MELKPDQETKLNDFYREYSDKKLPPELSQIILDEFGIDISTNYFDQELKNPIMVAPGQLTLSEGQIRGIVDAGYGGVVLKSVVGEDKNGNASMSQFRKTPTFIKTVFDEKDIEKRMPIILWDGGLDTRELGKYLVFAENSLNVGKEKNVPIIASFLSHLPQKGEEWKEEEWVYTAERFSNLGFAYIEIDFCPFLKGENVVKNKETVLDWYRKSPELIKRVKGIKVLPKLLNLDFGPDFQLEMVKASIEGGADGVVIANRIYKQELKSPYGGLELKERNIEQIKNVRENGLDIPIVGTGGVYSGKDVLDYLKLGVPCVEILSYIMGKWSKPVETRKDKFELVLYEILLNPVNGLVAGMLDLKNREGISGIRELYY